MEINPLDYMSKVKIIAKMLCKGTSFPLEDVTSMGTIGLMDAIRRFDPSKGVKFGVYAEFRIKGEIIDRLYSARRRVRPTKEAYKFNLPCSPPSIVDSILMDEIKKKTETLPAQQREVIKLCYFDEMGEKEISIRLGLSQQRINQIKLDAIKRLKCRMNA